MYIQIKMYQGEAAYRKQSLGKQSRDRNALSIWHLEYLHWKDPMQAGHRFTVVLDSHDINMPLLACIGCLMGWD